LSVAAERDDVAAAHRQDGGAVKDFRVHAEAIKEGFAIGGAPYTGNVVLAFFKG
jgi:hypothetical protein